MTEIRTPADLRAAIEQPDWADHAPSALEEAATIASAFKQYLDDPDFDPEPELKDDFERNLYPTLHLTFNHEEARDRAYAIAHFMTRVLMRANGAAKKYADIDPDDLTDLTITPDLARDIQLALGTDLSGVLDLALHLGDSDRDLNSRDLSIAVNLADKLAGLSEFYDADAVMALFDWVGSIIYGLVAIVNPGSTAPESEAEKRLPIRQEVLSGDERSHFGREFEGLFEAVRGAALDGLLVDPDAEELVISLAQEFGLAWRRRTVGTRHLEDLIAELLRILNGSIVDIPMFCSEFERFGVDADTAVELSERLAGAIAALRDGLGDDDPVADAELVLSAADLGDEVFAAVESGLADETQATSRTDSDELPPIEPASSAVADDGQGWAKLVDDGQGWAKLVDEAKSSAAKSYGAAVGKAAVVGPFAGAGAVWMALRGSNPFARIAIEVLKAFGRLRGFYSG